MEDFFDTELERLLVELRSAKAGTDEYKEVLEQINSLVHIDDKLHEKEVIESRLDKVLSNPALLGLIGNLSLALLILNFERANIVTTRALSFIRPK